MARPTKLDPKAREKILESLRAGMFRRHAAALVGVTESTLSVWYNRGHREARGLYHDFAVAVDAAEAEFAQAGVEQLVGAAPHNPRIMQWLLSRRFPAEYGRRDNVEPTGTEDSQADAQALRELLIERLQKLAPEPEPDPVEEPTAEVAPEDVPEPDELDEAIEIDGDSDDA